MAIKLLGADGITQQLLNWIREARDTAVQKAGEAGAAANVATGARDTALQHRDNARDARDQSREWAEGMDATGLPGATPESRSSRGWMGLSREWAEGNDVTSLPGATPESKSAKKWSDESKEFRDQSKTFRDQAETLVGRAAGEGAKHGSVITLARLLLGDADTVWDHADVEDAITVTGGTWTPGAGGLPPALTMQAGVGRLTRSFDLTASPETNPLAGLETAALYLMAEEAWAGTVRLTVSYTAGGGGDGVPVLAGSYTGVAVRGRVLVAEQLDRPEGATHLNVTVSWQIEDDVTIREAVLVTAPFVGVDRPGTGGGGGAPGQLGRRRPRLIERGANTIVTEVYDEAMLVATAAGITITLPDTLEAGFGFWVINRASGGVTLAAEEVVNSGPGSKVEPGGMHRVTHLGDGVWAVTGNLSA